MFSESLTPNHRTSRKHRHSSASTPIPLRSPFPAHSPSPIGYGYSPSTRGDDLYSNMSSPFRKALTTVKQTVHFVSPGMLFKSMMAMVVILLVIMAPSAFGTPVMDEVEPCPDIIEPVCGENNVTYSSQCYAARDNIRVLASMSCEAFYEAIEREAGLEREYRRQEAARLEQQYDDHEAEMEELRARMDADRVRREAEEQAERERARLADLERERIRAEIRDELMRERAMERGSVPPQTPDGPAYPGQEQYHEQYQEEYQEESEPVKEDIWSNVRDRLNRLKEDLGIPI